jgi:hypothetical protein
VASDFQSIYSAGVNTNKTFGAPFGADVTISPEDKAKDAKSPREHIPR